MLQTWRWFGPNDPVAVPQMLQAGVQGVVTALHHIAPGAVWSLEEIGIRQSQIANLPSGSPSGLAWEVVESLPVSEAIKTQSKDMHTHLEAYRQSLRHLSASGISTLCYNFMPVLDWTRTDLAAPLPHGGHAMKFDLVAFATFDLCILQRAGARDDFDAELVAQAEHYFASLNDVERNQLERNIVAGLPGANDNWTLADVRAQLATYDGIDASRLRQNLIDFLGEVIPEATRLGIRLCAHPDDPPFDLMGLPRVLSNEADYLAMTSAVDEVANGVTFCTGSLGVSDGFDALSFLKTHAPRIHFAHLRNTTRVAPRSGTRSSFYEAAHLEGDTDMVAVVAALLDEEKRRRVEGRQDHCIPFRPDHGQALLSDLEVGSMPGYPLIGRMRGLAELRGVMTALSGLA